MMRNARRARNLAPVREPAFLFATPGAHDDGEAAIRAALYVDADGQPKATPRHHLRRIVVTPILQVERRCHDDAGRVRHGLTRVAVDLHQAGRVFTPPSSEERRGGEEGGSTGRPRWSND